MKYRHWSQEDLEKAKEAVVNGLSQRKASAKYGVPQATLSDHLRGKIEDGTPMGRPPVFPRKVEESVVQRVVEAAEKGVGVTRLQLMQRAGHVAKALQLKTPWKKAPGPDWWKGFKSRNTDITIRKPEGLSSIRSRAVNPTVVGQYFIDLKSILGKGFTPSTIWNMDETHMNFTHTPSRVIASKSARTTPGRVSNSREGVTVFGCGSAYGVILPPLFVVKGKTRKSVESYNISEGPVNAKWTYQR